MPAEYCVGRRSYLLVDDVGHIQPTGATKNQHGWTKNGHCTAAFQNCKHSTRPPSVASHASVLRGEGETRRDVHGWNHAGPGSRFHHVAFRKPMYYSWQNPPPIIDIHIIPNIKELPKPCTCVFSRLKKDVTEGWVAGELGNHSAMGNPFYRNSMDGEQSKAKGRRPSVVPSLRVTKSMSPHYCSFFSWVQLHTIAGIEMHREIRCQISRTKIYNRLLRALDSQSQKRNYRAVLIV